MRKTALYLILVLSVATILSLAGFALPSESQDDARDQEIQELKALVRQLADRLEKLESDKAAEAEATPTAEEKVVTVEQAKQEDVDKLKKEQKRNNQRLMKVERETGLDRVRFTGDYRFEAHSIHGTTPDHFDGMKLQSGLVDTLFYYGATGQFPPSLEAVSETIRENYADYLYYTDNLTFEDLKNAAGMFPPEQFEQLMGFLLPHTFTPERNTDNGILYTNRLRLRMDARVGENVTFMGRLGMYKTFGDSTGVQVFNGQSNSLNIDGTTVGVPNSDVLRVERAFVTWSNIGGAPVYLSVGRRPSTGGAPVNYRMDEPRGGTPAGSLINYQYDGLTFGWKYAENASFRLCYGIGYESGFGNGSILKDPKDRLDDTPLFGINWDIWNSERMLFQATIARAFDVADGFNGLVVMPNDPVTGQEIPAPLMMRYTPSANLGHLNLGSLVLTRRDGPIDWFVSGNIVNSSPFDVTTPFGGLFSDPFETPEGQTGSMIYTGLRWNSSSERTKLGFEFNKGSKYWFNFAQAEDDLIAPKTATRGNVYEAYVTHRIRNRFVVKANYIYYDYIWSGSGWHVGSPKKLDSMPILGFPTYDKVGKFAVSLIARF
jgi:hypothetical protein